MHVILSDPSYSFEGLSLHPRLRREIGEGLRYVFTHPLLRPIALNQTTTRPGWGLAWYVLGTLLAAIGIIVSYILAISARQRLCPPDLQGRVSATMSFVSWGAAPIGSLVGGLTATAIGLRPTLLLAGLATFLGSAWLLFSPLRTLRTIPEVSPR